MNTQKREMIERNVLNEHIISSEDETDCLHRYTLSMSPMSLNLDTKAIILERKEQRKKAIFPKINRPQEERHFFILKRDIGKLKKSESPLIELTSENRTTEYRSENHTTDCRSESVEKSKRSDRKLEYRTSTTTITSMKSTIEKEREKRKGKELPILLPPLKSASLRQHALRTHSRQPPETIDLAEDEEIKSAHLLKEKNLACSQEILFSYSFHGHKKCKIQVTRRDEQKLDEGEYLNDTLIDFGLHWYCDKATKKNPRIAENTHIFSCFFFTDLFRTIHSTKTKFSGLEKWIPRTGLFNKKYAIIPVNERSHWYLMIACNIDRCIPSKVTGSNDDEEAPHAEPYIFSLDSLGCTRSRNLEHFSNYLQYEAESRLGISKSEFIKPTLISSNVPKQTNGTDCGLFLLHFVQHFFTDPERYIIILREHSQDHFHWFESEMPFKRQELRSIITRLHRLWRYQQINNSQRIA
ncbi:hypothetical protein BDF14DRAFT_1757908 [Spinellus fusiger]|nr:hypothetical protein BDF14DRAFT_1757908 [Spinellus fusiger]